MAVEGAERVAAEMEAVVPQEASAFVHLLNMHVEQGE